jgi:hypothetical protein
MKNNVGLLVFCLCLAGSAKVERALNTAGFLSSGPVLVTANIPGPHVVCCSGTAAREISRKTEG